MKKKMSPEKTKPALSIVRLPIYLDNEINRQAMRTGQTRSAIVRQALDKFFNTK